MHPATHAQESLLAAQASEAGYGGGEESEASRRAVCAYDRVSSDDQKK